MKTIFTPSRVFLLLALAVASFGAYESERAVAGQHPNQCWRFVWQPPDACTLCGLSCQGAGYRCCSFTPEPL